MESLAAQKIRKLWAERPEAFPFLSKLALSLAVIALFLFPLFAVLARSLFEWDSVGLSVVFFKLVLRSVGFTALQALLSAGLASGLGIFLGTLIAFFGGRGGLRLSGLTLALGIFSFALPGVAVSLLVMQIGHRLEGVPSMGLGAIVFAHLILNLLFVASAVESRVRSFLSSGALDLLEAAALCGARGLALWKSLLGSLLWSELKQWFALIFLWSFSAFATVLILGGGPAYSSPEVLLFYSLQNDLNGARLLLLLFIQGGIGFTLAGLLASKSKELSFGAANSSAVLHLENSRLVSAPRVRGIAVILFFICAAPILACVLGTPVEILTDLEQARTNLDLGGLWQPALHSTLLALTVAAIVFCLCWMLLMAGPVYRKNLLRLMGLSTTFLAALWMGMGLDRFSEHRVAVQFLCAALAIALTQIPFAALWIEARVRALAPELSETARTLGCSETGVLRFVHAPQMQDVFVKLSLVSAIGAIGELSVASLFVRDLSLLSVESRKMASRYDFSGSSWVLFLMMALTAAFLAVQKFFFWQRTAPRPTRKVERHA